MAKNPANKPPKALELTENQVTTAAAMKAAADALATASADLEALQSKGDDADAIAKASATVAELQKQLETATEAKTQADADAKTVQPPVTPDPAPVAAAEAEVKTFIQKLQAEAKAAEQRGEAALHAWLTGLEGHLASVKNHLEQLHPQATAEIKTVVADLKKLF